MSIRYLYGKLEELYDAAAILKEYVSDERIMEQIFQSKGIEVKGLPHKQYIKARLIEKIVNRLCEDSTDGNIITEDILRETEKMGINTYKMAFTSNHATRGYSQVG